MRHLYLAKNDKDRPVEAACFGNEVQEELKVLLVFLTGFMSQTYELGIEL